MQTGPYLIAIAARSWSLLWFNFLLRMTFHVFWFFFICVVIVLQINEEIYFQILGIEFSITLVIKE